MYLYIMKKIQNKKHNFLLLILIIILFIQLYKLTTVLLVKNETFIEYYFMTFIITTLELVKNNSIQKYLYRINNDSKNKIKITDLLKIN
jgi:hypothetical protein